MEDDESLSSFGSVHRAVHGCGVDVVTKVLSTCEEMLVDRGCQQVGKARKEDISSFARTGFPPVLWGEDEGGRKTEVFLVSEEKVSVKQARSILEDCHSRHGEGGDWIAIVVSPGGVTPFARKECEGKQIRFFVARDLYFNVSRHSLVPRHEVVPSPPAGVEKKELPRILDTDRIVQYYDWPIGTVVKITRCFGGHEPIPYYRVVVGG